MSPRRRLGKKLLKSLLPIVITVVLAAGIALALVVYGVTRPPRNAYLVTKESFSQISSQASKVSDQSWPNRDGTQARGWLLRGIDGAPAVVLLHRYGTDRSWLFNLGIKINETTNFTILWPDLRGHGVDPPVRWTTFGVHEGDDTLAAIDFLRTLKTASGKELVGQHIGLYGVELGAFAALKGAEKETNVSTLVLDSVPRSSDDLLQSAVKDDLTINNDFVFMIVRQGLRMYFLGDYQNVTACEVAASLRDKHVLLLSGPEARNLRETTASLARCFQDTTRIETKTDLPLTGFNLPSATGELGEGYDRRVIDFFDRHLRQPSRP
jgi:pimeloyl-ACP methyl ester carboxylesterase